MKFQKTFEPMYIGSMRVKNRLVVPPMDSGLTELNGEIKNMTVDYYSARAKGGFGMVIVQVAAVHPTGIGLPGEVDLSSDEFIPGLSRVADGIKRYGSRAVIQLTHGCRQTTPEMIGTQPIGASSVPCSCIFCRSKTREMTTAEVYQLIDWFVRAAVRAKKAGFNAVEIHGAHGYGVEQFLSPRSNKRIDEFGGGIEGRCYLPKLIVEGIKKSCGKDFPVIFRLGTDEKRMGGIDENIAVIHAQLMESYGYDAIHISAGTATSMSVIIPPSDTPPAWNINATKLIKSAVTIPVIAVGRYNDPQVIEHAISRGDVDFISLGRQSIADPEFPNKMFSEQLMDIVPCISCSQRCMFEDPDALPEGDYPGLSCMLNPMSNARPEVQIKPAETAKKVVVVGAGPAGLESAWIAASRGHEVTLFEKNNRSKAGGQFLIASYPPFKQDLTRPIRHYLHMCEKHGVVMNFGLEATKELIEAENPDVVIIATGANPIQPRIPGMDTANILQANDVLLGELVSGDVLVIGGGLVGVETAEFCVEYCDSVTVVEMMPEIAPGLTFTVRGNLLQRFNKEGIKVYTETKILEIDRDQVVCDCKGTNMTLDGFSSIILAMGSRSYNPFSEIEDLATEVYVVGDAKKARTAVHAIYEAAMVALNI